MLSVARRYRPAQRWQQISHRCYATRRPKKPTSRSGDDIHENLPTRKQLETLQSQIGTKQARTREEILAARPPPPSRKEKTNEDEDEEEQEPEPRRSFFRSSIYGFVIGIPIVAFAMSHSPFDYRWVTGPSMKPTMNADCTSESDTNYNSTRVLVQKWNLYQIQEARSRMSFGKNKGRSIQAIDRGDIVMFDTPHDPEKVAVKRVIAIAGDIVRTLPGYGTKGTEGESQDVIIPWNHFWVEGDVGNKKDSLDSNCFGPISLALIQGKVVTMWSPWWNLLGMRTTRTATMNYEWPARKQGRVKENAVQDATIDPDKVALVDMLQGENALGTLIWIENNGNLVKQRFEDEESYKLQVFKTYRESVTMARHHPNVEVRETAAKVSSALRDLLGTREILDVDPNARRRKIRQQNPGVSEDSIDDLLSRSRSGRTDAVNNV